MAAIAVRLLQRSRRRSSTLPCAFLRSGFLCGSEVSSRPAAERLAANLPSTLQRVSHTSVAAYSSSRSLGHSYASDVHTYNNVIDQINFKKRNYLSRDVYEDMLLDGVQPVRDTFYLLITGSMQCGRLQDVMFFFDEMKAMGITPDVPMYNCIIAACGKSQQIDRAFQVAEEMEAFGVQPKHRTFLALLRACALAGRVDEAYGVVRRMAAHGHTLDQHCYAALITAYRNKKPQNEETVQKIFELLEQSKMTSALDVKAVAATGETESDGDAEDWLLSFLTGEVQLKRGFLNHRLAAYHAAISAFQSLGNREALKKVLQMIELNGQTIDVYCAQQWMKCLIGEGDFEEACSEYNKYLELGRRPSLDLYLVLIDGALTYPSPANSAIAQKLLTELVEKGFFLNVKTAGELLSKACQEKTRDIAVANIVWDMTQNRGMRLSGKVITEYYKALERSGTSESDPRLTQLRSLLEENRRFGLGRTSVQRAAAREPEFPVPDQVHVVPIEVSPEKVVAAEACVVEETVEDGPEDELIQAHSEDAGDTVTPPTVPQ